MQWHYTALEHTLKHKQYKTIQYCNCLCLFCQGLSLSAGYRHFIVDTYKNAEVYEM